MTFYLLEKWCRNHHTPSELYKRAASSENITLELTSWRNSFDWRHTVFIIHLIHGETFSYCWSDDIAYYNFNGNTWRQPSRFYFQMCLALFTLVSFSFSHKNLPQKYLLSNFITIAEHKLPVDIKTENESIICHNFKIDM